MRKTIEELLEAPYWVIDILPRQVPKDGPGQYFAVESYYLEKDHFDIVKQKHIDLILKLNCYCSISIDEGRSFDPSPEQIVRRMREEYLCMIVGDSLIVSEPDDTSMTVYDPDDGLLELIETLAAGEGLYVWKPPV